MVGRSGRVGLQRSVGRVMLTGGSAQAMDEHDAFGRMVADAAGVLGLEPSAAQDPRALKRAYATMLKRHRPDQDPEGFRRVRDAYELLTSFAQRPPVETGEPAPVVSAPAAATATAHAAPPVVPEPAVDDALAQAITRLTAVCAATQEESSLVGAGWQVWRLARTDQVARGLAAVGTAFGERPHLLGQVLGDEGVLLAFTHERGDLGAAVFQYWTRHDTPRLAAFAKELLAHLGKGNGEFALLGLRLAEVLSLREPAVAESLLNRLFLDLPPQMRGATLMIEQRVVLGRELAGLTMTARHFVWEAIDRDQTTPPPLVPTNVLTELETLPADHPVRAVLREVMPDLTLGFNYGGAAVRRGGAPMQVYTRRDSYREAREVDSSGTNWRMPFGVAFVLFLLVSAAIRGSPTYSPPPRIEPPRPQVQLPEFRQPSSPGLDPQNLRIPYGTRELTPEQREVLRRLTEQHRKRTPQSQQDQLRRVMDGSAAEVPVRVNPGPPPAGPEVER